MPPPRCYFSLSVSPYTLRIEVTRIADSKSLVGARPVAGWPVVVSLQLSLLIVVSPPVRAAPALDRSAHWGHLHLSTKVRWPEEHLSERFPRMISRRYRHYHRFEPASEREVDCLRCWRHKKHSALIRSCSLSRWRSRCDNTASADVEVLAGREASASQRPAATDRHSVVQRGEFTLSAEYSKVTRVNCGLEPPRVQVMVVWVTARFCRAAVSYSNGRNRGASVPDDREIAADDDLAVRGHRD